MFLTVFGMLNRITYLERTNVTTPFVSQSNLPKVTTQGTEYKFETTVHSYLTINESIICHPKSIVKLEQVPGGT